MKTILALDLSSSTGYAVFHGKKLAKFGILVAKAQDFDVNKKPEKSKLYPYNVVSAANLMATQVADLVSTEAPDAIVIENTVKGRNRHTQRYLEFIHKAVLDLLEPYESKITYMDPSQWRSLINLRLTNEDKKHNKAVTAGKIRGKLTRKHLSVRMANEAYSLELKLKDNDIADAICLGAAYLKM